VSTQGVISAYETPPKQKREKARQKKLSMSKTRTDSLYLLQTSQGLERNQQFFPVRVAVIPPLVTGEDPGATPKIQEVSAVVSG